ncbi:uncharacterized protein [Dysidea avara]|uniref:uncharacterized protein isoform X2 n=1 Tax=Dysidea avara TaxID=196820 RepID=UPI00331B8CBE
MTLTVFLTVYILLCWVYITCADSFCADDLADWTVTITNQSELNQFLNNATSRDNIRCVHLSLAAGNSYKLDIVKFMQINLEHNASLIVVGEGGGVDINCTASLSDLEELRKLNLSLSRASLVMLDGLVFTSCPLPIVIEEVLTVVINNCHFLHHEHGAVSIYNSQDVTVKNCKFLNNTSDSYFTGRPYQGAAGGLSIGHYSVVSNVQLNNISILITDCNFTGNFASPPSNLTVTSTEVLMNQIITGRGGAVIVLVNVDTPFHFVTRNSFFLNNVADNIGGVFYCLTNGGKINQTFMFHNSVFIGNSGSSAGAVAFIILLNRPVDFVVHYIVRNCTFTDNLANSGVGGATTFSSLYGIPNIFSLFEYCIFINNTAALSGGAVDITSYNFFETRNVIPVIFRNCVFDGNVAVTGSAINLAYYSVTIDGVTFVDNKGTTVAANKGQMFFHGSVKFHGNMVNETFGGALDLLYSEMILTNDTHIEFKYNTAYIGAAISADGPRKVVPVFHKNHYNRLCFLRYHNSLVPLAQLDPHKVSMTFTGNDAIVGSDIYADHLDYCSWYSNSHPYFQSNMRNIFRWPFISYDKNEYTNHKMVSTDTSMPVISSTTDFLVLNNTVKAYPGEQINIIIIPYDEQKFTSFAIFEIKDLESLNSQRNPGFGFDFTPTVQFMYPGKSNYFVTSNIVTDNAAAITSTLLENTHVIQVSRSFEPDKVHQFNLTITPCPPGHTLRRNDLEDLYSCGCNDEKNIDIVNCLPGTRKLIIKDGYWAHRIKDINVNGELIYHWCPPGYCRCTSLDDVTGTCSSVYYFDNDDLQCVCDREGHLCGKCHANKGVSVLLDKCVDCGYDHAMLIVGLGTANVIVIIVILLSHATLLAWLYPFLYYIQVTPYIAKYFPLTFGAIQPYLHYISSTISLYFPYDFCLYPGMTALVSYTIRYIPFVLTTVIAVIFHIINSWNSNIQVQNIRERFYFQLYQQLSLLYWWWIVN